MSTKKKAANTAKQVSAQAKIKALEKTVNDLKRECKEERQKSVDLFKMFRTKTRQCNTLTEELQKSKRWANLRSDQVGQLINVLELNAKTKNAKFSSVCIDEIAE